MIHPSPPREKVVFKQPCDHCQRMTSVDLTALASGSGDHAELARLADMADWMADGDPGANGSVLLSASVASEHASDLKALLAENAALRAKIQTEIKLSVDNYVRATARATEAERKLAEAVGLLREARDDLVAWASETPASDYAQDMDIPSRIDAFLSKEAEQ